VLDEVVVFQGVSCFLVDDCVDYNSSSVGFSQKLDGGQDDVLTGAKVVTRLRS
jgi:hypothetical protein